MLLSRYHTPSGTRWAVDGTFLTSGFNLSLLLELPAAGIPALLENMGTGFASGGDLLAPLDPTHEIWACGVTYLRSRDARIAESQVGDVYQKVYQAERPELFFKATGLRAAGHGQPVRIRRDSAWNVPEPELVLVINSRQEIVGYCAGNDVSSRSIESENPLYLPQAKIYNGACALGPAIQLCSADEMRRLPIHLEIQRAGQPVFLGETSLLNMKRSLEELVECLYFELDFPQGVLLFTGTGIVPPDTFTLQSGDQVNVQVGSLTIENEVQG